jgi:hypothetical protein
MEFAAKKHNIVSFGIQALPWYTSWRRRITKKKKSATVHGQPSQAEMFIVSKLWNHLNIFWTNVFLSTSLTFFTKKTYNDGMHARTREDLSTHLECDPKLWLEDRVTSEPHRNRVHGISITMARDIKAGYSVSSVSTPQSRPSQSSPTI